MTPTSTALEALEKAKKCADFLLSELRFERADVKDGVGPEIEQAHGFLRDYLDKNNPIKYAALTPSEAPVGEKVYIFAIDGPEIEVKVKALDEQSARHLAWKALSDEERNKAASVELIDVLEDSPHTRPDEAPVGEQCESSSVVERRPSKAVVEGSSPSSHSTHPRPDIDALKRLPVRGEAEERYDMDYAYDQGWNQCVDKLAPLLSAKVAEGHTCCAGGKGAWKCSNPVSEDGMICADCNASGC